MNVEGGDRQSEKPSDGEGARWGGRGVVLYLKSGLPEGRI